MFENVIDSVEGLREFYREPSQVVTDKTIDHVDEGAAAFIAASTFVLVATSDGTELDVSPRGGAAGFVKVLDEHHIAIPDLNGNNRLDTLRNVVTSPNVGLLFLIPGLGETLRINGTACVTLDDAVLDRFTDDYRRPKSALGITVNEAFIHCAKSIRRGNLWNTEAWAGADDHPSPGEILVAHAGVTDITGAELDGLLEAGYARDLAQD